MHTKLWNRLTLAMTVVAVMAMLLFTSVAATTTVEEDPLAAASVGESIVNATHEVYSLDWSASASTTHGI